MCIGSGITEGYIHPSSNAGVYFVWYTEGSMDITKAARVYFVGIGGAGMSSLAQLLVSRGVSVSGADRGASKTTELLREKGVEVFFTHAGAQVGDAEVLVYSDAVPKDNPERVYAREQGIPEYSYFGALGQVSRTYKTIAIAGTHGKTTTTAMVAGCMKEMDPTVIVGSIMKETGSNVRIGGSEWLVVEACEYKDHFLELVPYAAVITNIELDHTDYFPNIEAVRASYKTFVEKIPQEGVLVVDLSTEEGKRVAECAACRVVDSSVVSAPELLVPGEFNRKNAAGARAVVEALFPGVSADECLASFPGTWRRFEYRGEVGSVSLYDDYAHHPTEVAATLTAAKETFKDKKVAVCFQPHLYSRTKEFFNEFADALSIADKVYLTPIFAAREEWDGETTSEKLAERIPGAEVVGGADELVAAIEGIEEETIFFTMGAGDVYTWVSELVEPREREKDIPGPG